MRPRARLDELVVRELPDEVLIYDKRSHRAHCLNVVAASVWQLCDGEHDVVGIAERLAIEESCVWLALDRLGRARLLAQRVNVPASMRGPSRREWIRRALRLSVVLPLVTSILTPTPVQAAATCVANCSGQPDFTPCGPAACVNVCIGGTCT